MIQNLADRTGDERWSGDPNTNLFMCDTQIDSSDMFKYWVGGDTGYGTGPLESMELSGMEPSQVGAEANLLDNSYNTSFEV